MFRYSEMHLSLLAVLVLSTVAMADESINENNTAASSGASAKHSSGWLGLAAGLPHPHPEPKTPQPRLVPWVDYTGDLTQRTALTGDWGGLRQGMMDKGIRLNVNLTQTLQGNIGGGASKRAWYQGGLRYEVDLDTGAAGLWPGGMLHVRGETQYGQNNNLDSGAILPVNTDARYPIPDQTTCLSEAYYTQFLTPWFGVIAGKISPRDNNIFAHDETTQFMNTAFVFNPVLGTTVPLDFLAAGVILVPTDWLTLTTLVLDSEGKANASGFDTVFDRGTSIYQMAEFAIKPFDLPGHQRVSWTWSDRVRTTLRQNPRLIIREIILERLGLGNGPVLKTESSDYSIMYDFDQYVYIEPGTTNQGIGLFGRFGMSSGKVNPVQYFYSIGLGGKGIIPSRDNDTFGAGFYCVNASDKMGALLNHIVGDEMGIEMYYNIEVTPWLHITPDIQIIDPGRKRYSDTTVVAGLRIRLDF